MLEILRRDPYNGRVKHIGYFEDLDALCNHFHCRDELTDIFGYTDNDRTDTHQNIFGEAEKQTPFEYVSLPNVSYKYVVYDTKGNLITPDHIVGRFRYLWEKDTSARHARFNRRYRRHAARKQAYGGFRQMSTTNEKRHAFDEYIEEYGVTVRIRPARKVRALPDSWWDRYAHGEKCWKHQTKRKHQWKPLTSAE
jgi:hypothetical protein